MQRIRCLGFLLSVLALLSCTAGEKTLSLSDCLKMALEKNLDIRIQKESPAIARYNLSVSYARYEPTFTGSYERRGSQEPGGIDEFNRVVPGSSADTDTWRLGVGGLLPWGMTYSLGAGMGNTFGDRFATQVLTNGAGAPIATNTIALPFEFSSGQIGFFELRQPMLRGGWTDDARLTIQLNRANIRLSETGLRRQIMTTAHAVEIAYYTLIAAADGVRVSEKALELAERLLSENKKRVEVGALAPLDEKQAEAEVATRKADLLTSRRLLEDQQNLLKSLVTDDYSSWVGTSILPGARLTAVPVVLQLSDSWLVALTIRPELLEAKINLEKQDITVQYQKNLLYPQFDLVGTYGWAGGGDAREYTDVWQQWDSGDNPFFSVGAQLSVPLGNRAARNNLRAARATREQLLLGLKKLEQSIMMDVDNSIGAVRTSFERVQATREARVYAQAALEAEQKKLENGKSTSFLVLQFQRDLTSAAYTEIRALADYNNALANLWLAEGTTLDRLNLEIEIR